METPKISPEALVTFVDDARNAQAIRDRDGWINPTQSTAIVELADQLSAAQRELEQVRVQLAGCGVAALGGTTEAVVVKEGQYGWSVTYRDVLNLRRKYDALQPGKRKLTLRAVTSTKVEATDDLPEHYVQDAEEHEKLVPYTGPLRFYVFYGTKIDSSADLRRLAQVVQKKDPTGMVVVLGPDDDFEIHSEVAG